MVQSDRRSWGRSAILAGSLWAASVAAELIFRPQRPDGSVEDMAVFAVSLAAAVVGSLFLVHAFHGLRKLVTASGTRSLISRIGAWCAVLGAALLVLFTLLGLVSGLVTGKVWEPSFLVFALAMLLLLVGQVTVGITNRRLPGLGPLLIVAGACVLVAVVVPVDPWHDIGLFSLFACWIGLGLLLQRTTTRPQADRILIRPAERSDSHALRACCPPSGQPLPHRRRGRQDLPCFGRICIDSPAA